MWRQSYVVSAYIATLSYVTLSCHILSCHVRYCLRVPVKLTVYGCQLSYRKFYVFFFVFFTVNVSLLDYGTSPERRHTRVVRAARL